MKKIQTSKQESDLKSTKKTYFARDSISTKDLAVIRYSKDFKGVNTARHYQHAVNHAVDQFKIVDELVRKMPPSYTYKILSSPEFKNFMRTITETKTFEVPMLDEKSRELVISHAAQMLEFSIAAIIKSMPESFKTSLIESITPFSHLVTAISNYAKKTDGNEIINSDLSFLHPDKLRKLPPRK